MKNIIILSLFLFAFPVQAETVSYQLHDQAYEGFYTSPEDNAPLVLLLHDWDGLTEYEIQRAQMLAQQGYSVFAADLFGAGIRPTENADKRQHTGELYKDRAKMRLLIQAALIKAGEMGADTDNVVIMGYCFGGAAVLEAARAGTDYKGFVSFHGGLNTPEGQDYSATKEEILILHGADDHHISMADFAALGEELEIHSVKYEMIAYGGARHAFTVLGGDRYHAEADRKSWQRFIQFLENKLK
ncbi:dienelactone hydrolase family protein [Methylophaga sp.]|uniref:dienelactone hydrolase family protein n=1 Tax=Methylophaga sp. TaxID=2024840 RepID=UPI003F6987FE